MTTPTSGDETIASKISEIWRPFYAFGALAILSLIGGAVVTAIESAAAMQISSWFAIACIACACIRTLIWWLVAGRIAIFADQSGLSVVRRGRVLRHLSWMHIHEVQLVWGDHWPEWNRWATFPHVSFVIDDGSGRQLWHSPGLLLFRPRDVERAEEALAVQVSKYAGGPPE